MNFAVVTSKSGKPFILMPFEGKEKGPATKGTMTYDTIETGTLLFLCGGFAVWEIKFVRPSPSSPLYDTRHESERRWNLYALLACLAFVGLTRALWSFALSGGQGITLPFDLGNQRFSWWRALAALAFVDFCVYWVHRAMHTFPLLWRTHRFHHFPTRLTWVAGFRASLTQTFLWTAPQYLLFVFFDFSWKELAAAVAVGLWFQLWEHTRSLWGHRVVEWFVATPGSHIHHHRRDNEGHQAVNFSPVFTFWDRLFGTFEASHAARGLTTQTHPPLGVSGSETPSNKENLRALVGY